VVRGGTDRPGGGPGLRRAEHGPPAGGGQYAFFREAFHPLAAFLHGWSLLLIIQSGATAAVAVAFAQYVARLVHVREGLLAPLAVAILLALSAFHALGIKPGAVLINVITFGKPWPSPP